MMTATLDPALLDHPWRPSDAWELVLADRAPDGERALLAQLGDDPSLYGLLRPLGEPPGRSLRAVDRETALLLLTLGVAPGPIPAYARRPDPAAALPGLFALALDGVLAIAMGERWLTGGAALELLPADSAAQGGRPDALAELSRAALRHAAAASDTDPFAVAGRLYRFGFEPLAPAARRRLGDELADAGAVLAWLGLAPGGGRRRALEGLWRIPPESHQGWLPFEPRRAATRPAGPSWKLYYSPRLAALPETLEAFATTVARRGGHAFKLGADLGGLLRPDKAVAYFPTFEALAAAGQELAMTLAGVPAQGVPFTAPFEATGLVSWGVDPPVAESLPWWGRQSWRLWVAQRLGSALVAARGDAAPVDTALARLALDGLDVERWTPSLSLWTTPAGSPT